jgi:hypothetical protein
MTTLSLAATARISLDGEEIVLPSEEQWASLLRGAKLGGKKTLATRLAEKIYRRISSDPRFRLGLRRLRADGEWTHIALVDLPQIVNQRVHLELLTCNSCAQDVWSANHLDRDLYIGTASIEANYKRAQQLPRAKCPTCGADLPRPSVATLSVTD